MKTRIVGGILSLLAVGFLAAAQGSQEQRTSWRSGVHQAVIAELLDTIKSADQRTVLLGVPREQEKELRAEEEKKSEHVRIYDDRVIEAHWGSGFIGGGSPSLRPPRPNSWLPF